MLNLSVIKSRRALQRLAKNAWFVFGPPIALLVIALLFFATVANAAVNDSKHNLSIRDYDYPKTQLNSMSSIWLIVNKLRPVSPSTFEPTNLEAPKSSASLDNSRGVQVSASVAAAISELAQVMYEEIEAQLALHSGFRSYEYQKELFAAKVKQYGEEVGLLRSAKAGFSEHQTGLAVDVSAVGYGCVIEQCFGETLAGMWLAENSWRYGFVIRYPEGQTAITGYAYEPWHLRYVGKSLANEFKLTGLATLEEFWGLPPAPDYLPEESAEETNS